MSSQQLSQILTCPYCNDENVVRHGLDHTQTRQRYTCRNPECGKNFFVPLKTSQIIAPIQRVRKAAPKVKTVKCPTCASTNLRRNGKPNGTQRYKCKSCNRDFRYSSAPELTKRQQIKANAKSEMGRQRTIHLSHLGVDSLDGICCFLCPTQEMCTKGSVAINPVICTKLDECFDVPPIHVKEIAYSEYPDDFIKGD